MANIKYWHWGGETVGGITCSLHFNWVFMISVLWCLTGEEKVTTIMLCLVCKRAAAAGGKEWTPSLLMKQLITHSTLILRDIPDKQMERRDGLNNKKSCWHAVCCRISVTKQLNNEIWNFPPSSLHLHQQDKYKDAANKHISRPRCWNWSQRCQKVIL